MQEIVTAPIFVLAFPCSTKMAIRMTFVATVKQVLNTHFLLFNKIMALQFLSEQELQILADVDFSF